MPCRVVRDGLIKSEKVNSLNDSSQMFFVRLLLIVDDHGRYDGRPMAIRTAAYPTTDICHTRVGEMLSDVCRVGLVQRYHVKGKDYIAIPGFDQRIRVKRARYPDPPSGMPDTCQTDVRHVSGICPTNDGLNPNPNPNPKEDNVGMSDTCQTDVGQEPSSPLSDHRESASLPSASVEPPGKEPPAEVRGSGPAKWQVEIEKIMAGMNALLDRSFKATTAATAKAIRARLDEGYTVRDFQSVVEHQHSVWKDDEKMRQYLTPATLFRPANFEKYLQAAKAEEVEEEQQTAEPGVVPPGYRVVTFPRADGA
jgi:uncharacterized phage protein (TIGR02220 family)